MSACPRGTDLARLVDGALTPDEGGAIAAHLAGCARCRTAQAELRGIVAQLAEGPIGAEPDLAPLVLRRAALPPRRRRPLLLGARVALPVAAAAALMFGFARPGTAPAGASDSAAAGFQARGASDGPDTWIALHAYRAEGAASRRLPPAFARMRAGDALLFAYDNGGPRPYRYLIIVGVDAADRHYYYQPDSTDPAATGVAIEPGPGHELRDEVRFPLAPGPLRIHAVFSRTPLALGTLERALAEAPAGARLALPDTGQHQLLVDVDGP